MEYKIGSFNLKNFGSNSKKDIEKIAQIIREEHLDIVALQEILSGGKGVKILLEQLVKHEMYGWDFCWASPSESSDPDKVADLLCRDKRGEGYAYLWDKRKFKLVETIISGQKRVYEPRIINTLSNDVYADCSIFARTPYFIRLQPIYGGFFEIRLINIHIYYGDNRLTSVEKRKAEYHVLMKDIYPSLSSRRYGNFRTAYTIAMGDYNLNIFTPGIRTANENYLTPVYSYSDGEEIINVLTEQNELSTLSSPNNVNEEMNGSSKRYANNYDHFTYSPQLSRFNKVSFSTIDAINKYCNGDFKYYYDNISDHIPIVMSVDI